MGSQSIFASSQGGFQGECDFWDCWGWRCPNLISSCLDQHTFKHTSAYKRKVSTQMKSLWWLTVAHWIYKLFFFVNMTHSSESFFSRSLSLSLLCPHLSAAFVFAALYYNMYHFLISIPLWRSFLSYLSAHPSLSLSAAFSPSVWGSLAPFLTLHKSGLLSQSF